MTDKRIKNQWKSMLNIPFPLKERRIARGQIKVETNQRVLGNLQWYNGGWNNSNFVSSTNIWLETSIFRWFKHQMSLSRSYYLSNLFCFALQPFYFLRVFLQ